MTMKNKIVRSYSDRPLLLLPKNINNKIETYDEEDYLSIRRATYINANSRESYVKVVQ